MPTLVIWGTGVPHRTDPAMLTSLLLGFPGSTHPREAATRSGT